MYNQMGIAVLYIELRTYIEGFCVCLQHAYLLHEGCPGTVYYMMELKVYMYSYRELCLQHEVWKSIYFVATHWHMLVCCTALYQYCFLHNQLHPHKSLF